MKTTRQPLQYFHILESNDTILENKIIFKPKGPCLFEAELKYQCGDLSITQWFESGKKMKVKDFMKAVRDIQIVIEWHFFNTVTARRLEALLNQNDELHAQLLNQPLIGEFKAWVL